MAGGGGPLRRAALGGRRRARRPPGDHRARGPVAHDARHGPHDAARRRRGARAAARARAGAAALPRVRRTLGRHARARGRTRCCAPLRDRGHMDVLRRLRRPVRRAHAQAAARPDTPRATRTWSSRRRRSSTASATTPTTADTWERCERGNRLVDEAITADWDRAEDGTVLRALVDAGTLSEDEVRANIKLFISGGLNEPRDVIATALHALLADPRAGGARARGPREPRPRRPRRACAGSPRSGCSRASCTRTPSSAACSSRPGRGSACSSPPPTATSATGRTPTAST